MSTTRDRRLTVIVAVIVVAVGLAWLKVARDVLHMDLLIYGIASFMFCVDLLDALARWRLARAAPTRESAAELPPGGPPLPPRPYALVLSVHNMSRHVGDFTRALGAYRDCTWIVDDSSSDGTALRLRAAGWRCLESRTNLKKPGALKALLAHLPAEIHTVMVLDPDMTIRGTRSEFETVMRDFQRSGAAAACPRIHVRPDGPLVSAQVIEYSLSCCLGRKSLGNTSVTSGVALYRRTALEYALSRHTLSVYAEDLENALLLLAAGEHIYYEERLNVETEGKRTLPEWFSQRVGWYFGLLRAWAGHWNEVRVIARRSPIAFYQYVIYSGVLSIFALPLRLVSLTLLAASLLNGLAELLGLAIVPTIAAADPLLFATVFVKHVLLMCIVICCALPASERWRALAAVPLYFFYVMSQLLPVAVGYANWLSCRLGGRRLYSDHYDRAPLAVHPRTAPCIPEATL